MCVFLSKTRERDPLIDIYENLEDRDWTVPMEIWSYFYWYGKKKSPHYVHQQNYAKIIYRPSEKNGHSTVLMPHSTVLMRLLGAVLMRLLEDGGIMMFKRFGPTNSRLFCTVYPIKTDYLVKKLQRWWKYHAYINKIESYQ